MKARAHLIGLGGYQEHGKDAAADALVLDRGWVKMGMSQPLNAALTVMNPWVKLSWIENYEYPEALKALWLAEQTGFARYADLVEAVGYTDTKLHKDARDYLRLLGTEVGRAMFGEDVWVDAAVRTITGHLRSGRSLAVTGIRYRNELDMIESLGGTTVWVERPGHPVPDTTHSSETTLGADDFMVCVENSGTLTELNEAAVRFADLLERS